MPCSYYSNDGVYAVRKENFSPFHFHTRKFFTPSWIGGESWAQSSRESPTEERKKSVKLCSVLGEHEFVVKKKKTEDFTTRDMLEQFYLILLHRTFIIMFTLHEERNSSNNNDTSSSTIASLKLKRDEEENISFVAWRFSTHYLSIGGGVGWMDRLQKAQRSPTDRYVNGILKNTTLRASLA